MYKSHLDQPQPFSVRHQHWFIRVRIRRDLGLRRGRPRWLCVASGGAAGQLEGIDAPCDVVELDLSLYDLTLAVHSEEMEALDRVLAGPDIVVSPLPHCLEVSV